MKIKSSARAKKVYLLLEAGSRADVEKTVLDYTGILGWAKASPVFVDSARRGERLILAIERRELNAMRAASEALNDSLVIPSRCKMVSLINTPSK